MTADHPPELRSLLKQYREGAGLTQEELAGMAGVSARGISDIERGISRRPRADTIKRLTMALDLRGVELEQFLAAARGRITLPQGDGDEDDDPTIPNLSAYVGAAYVQPATLVRIENAATSETPTVPLPPQPVAYSTGRQAVSIQDMSWVVILKGVVAIALVLLLILLIVRFEQAQMVTPSQAGSSSQPIVQSTSIEKVTQVTPGESVLDIAGGLQLSPMSKAPDGTIYVETGQIVTATFRVYDTGTQPAQLNAARVAVRGPGACTLGWNAPAVDFPAVTDVKVRPGESYFYQQARAFTSPGVYFAEPVKQGIEPEVSWGGIRPHPRVWFRVVDAKTRQLPDAECIVSPPDDR